jgi:folate-binding protein YgfZ
MVQAASVSAYTAARQRAAFIDRSSERGRILVSGRDRASFLHGLLTNDITAIGAGQGCYAAYLTAQGRMITDALVYELGDVILMTVGADVTDTMMTRLDRSIFTEDVQLENAFSGLGQVAILGPEAAAIVAAAVPSVSSDQLRALAEHANVRMDWSGAPAIITRITDAGIAGFEVFVDAARVSAFTSLLERQNVPMLDRGTADVIRIEAGVPLFHQDMDEETIPLEAGIEGRAISFTKGCYVGQEVIVRVLHRGHGRVARKLVGMRVDGTAPPARGALIRSNDREVGRVTSAAFSPSLAAPIALGYVHRDFVEPGARLTIDAAPAIVTALPFV